MSQIGGIVTSRKKWNHPKIDFEVILYLLYRIKHFGTQIIVISFGRTIFLEHDHSHYPNWSTEKTKNVLFLAKNWFYYSHTVQVRLDVEKPYRKILIMGKLYIANLCFVFNRRLQNRNKYWRSPMASHGGTVLRIWPGFLPTKLYITQPNIRKNVCKLCTDSARTRKSNFRQLLLPKIEFLLNFLFDFYKPIAYRQRSLNCYNKFTVTTISHWCTISHCC